MSNVPSPDGGAVEAANRMTAALGTLNGQLADLQASREETRDDVAELVAYGRRTRRLIHLLAASVVLDVLLSLGLAVVGYKAFAAANDARAATTTAKQLHQSNVALCRSGNEFRRLDRERWQSVIDLTAAQARTPEQQAARLQFIATVDLTDAPRDCSTVK